MALTDSVVSTSKLSVSVQESGSLIECNRGSVAAGPQFCTIFDLLEFDPYLLPSTRRLSLCDIYKFWLETFHLVFLLSLSVPSTNLHLLKRPIFIGDYDLVRVASVPRVNRSRRGKLK